MRAPEPLPEGSQHAVDASAAEVGLERVARARQRLLSTPYEAPGWLQQPHGQTIWSPLFRRKPRLSWSLERLATPDNDQLRLHWLASNTDLSAPTVLLLHGLEGSVESNYIGGQAALFAGRGWNVGVLEFRTCGGEMNRARRMYHLGETADLDFVVTVLVDRIRAGDLGGPLLLTGVSLGGNVIAKWLGETPSRVPAEVAAAAAVSLPFDLEVSGPHIDRALGGFYTWRFLRTLKAKAIEKERQYPGCVDVDRIKQAKTFVDFDTHGTARLHGFEDAWDYWRQSSCGQFLAAVNRPLLLLAAKDDPFNPAEAIPYGVIDDNPWLVGQFPSRGGHVGFVAGKPWRTQHWSEGQVDQFFATLVGE